MVYGWRVYELMVYGLMVYKFMSLWVYGVGDEVGDDVRGKSLNILATAITAAKMRLRPE